MEPGGTVRRAHCWWQIGLLVAACALLATGFQSIGVHGDDLAVYRTAGQAVLDGSNLYDELFDARLPFTYPPFAALVAVPVALGSWGAVQWGWNFVSLLMLAAIIVLSYREVPFTRKRPVVVYVGFLVLWTAASPISDHLGVRPGRVVSDSPVLDRRAGSTTVDSRGCAGGDRRRGQTGATRLHRLLRDHRALEELRPRSPASSAPRLWALRFSRARRSTTSATSPHSRGASPSVTRPCSVTSPCVDLPCGYFPRAWWVRHGSSPVRCWVSSELSRRGALSACGAISPVSRWWLCWRQS